MGRLWSSRYRDWKKVDHPHHLSYEGWRVNIALPSCQSLNWLSLAALWFTSGESRHLTPRLMTCRSPTSAMRPTGRLYEQPTRQSYDLGADWVRENGQLIIGGSGSLSPGSPMRNNWSSPPPPEVIRLKRRENEVFSSLVYIYASTTLQTKTIH